MLNVLLWIEAVKYMLLGIALVVFGFVVRHQLLLSAANPRSASAAAQQNAVGILPTLLFVLGGLLVAEGAWSLFESRGSRRH